MRHLETKFLVVFLALAAGVSSYFVYHVYRHEEDSIEHLMDEQSRLLLQFDLAIRSYMAEEVRPVVASLVDDDEFIPAAMSTSYAARSIAERVREEFPDYILKFSSDHPRNPLNQASPDELEMLEFFRDNPSIDESRVREVTINGKPYLARFKPRRLKQACLRCHSDPADAPKAILDRYGAEAGFGREAGDVVALDTVAVPMDKVAARVRAGAISNLVAAGVGLGVFFLATVTLFRLVVVRPLHRLIDQIGRPRDHPNQGAPKPIEVRGDDEVAHLGRAYNAQVRRVRCQRAEILHHQRDLRDTVNKRTRQYREANQRLQKAMAERRRSEQQLKAVLENVKVGIALISPDMEVLSLNRQMEKWFPDIDADAHPLCYQAYNDPPRDGPCDYCPSIKTLRDGRVHEALAHTPDGEQVRHYRIVSSPLFDEEENVTAVIELVDDVTDRVRTEKHMRRLNRKLKQQATTDELTGLVNRRYFHELLERERERSARTDRPCSLIMIDVDRFKEVNDRRGHQVGDRVLKAVADVIRDTVRTSDVVSRYGGDEFMVLLPETDGDGAADLAGRIRLAAAELAISDEGGETFRVTLSIGAAFERGDENSDEFVRRVDESLYHAKVGGRNRVILAGCEPSEAG